MKKRNIIILSFLLSSCNGNYRGYKNYIGNMYVSDAKKDFSTINSKKINDKYDLGDYYVDVYSFDIDNKEDFFKESDIEFSDSEIKKFDGYKDYDVVYFFTQIPSGYQAYKRDNVQGYLYIDEQTLLTDNFYYFISREIYYCDIDIVKNINYIEPYVFSFYFLIEKDLYLDIKVDDIRVNYYLHSS